MFHSPGRPDAAADHAQFPAVVISAGPFGAADVVPSGDTGGGGGGAALVIVRVRLAETELPFCVAVTVQSRDPSSAVVKARPSTRLSAVGMTRPTGETDSTPAKADPSLIATAAVEAGVPIGLLSGSERLAGVRVTEVGTGGGGRGGGVGSGRG